ncbi:transposase [Streptomyces sp. NPDC059611]|uniref:transposase n=1 Tax=Streptomyces sp. NPDC059611 TaxID=3346884 RepID=UPI00367B60BF
MGPQRRLHRLPGAPARRWREEKGDLQKDPPGGIATEPDDHGLGRSRGGLTTKLHLAVEQGQKPMAIVVTAGLCGDSPQFEPVLEQVRVPRLGPGRPRTRPDCVRADKAYASRKNRAYLRRRGIPCTIPDKVEQVRNRKKLGPEGRPSAEVRPGGLQGSTRGRVRHQPPQKAPSRGHEL